MSKTINLPQMVREAQVRADSFNADDNTIEIVWSTGAKVRRYDWLTRSYYDEELVMSANAVRLERLNAGAPFLNTHDSWDLSRIIGAVVEGSARIEGGKGVCRVRLSTAADVADAVHKIKEGVARNISVGYRLHKIEKTEGEDGDIGLWRVIDWEPFEVSSVPIPADAGAQVRADGKEPAPPSNETRTFPCVVIGGDETRDLPATTTTPSTSTEAAETRADNEGDLEMAKANETAAEQRGNENDTETRGAAPAAPAAPAVDAEAIRREAQNAERTRVSEITALAEKAGKRDLADKHIKDGSSVEDFRAALLDAMIERGKGDTPANGNTATSQVGGATNAEQRAAAITNAILHRWDMSKYPLDASAREFRGMDLLELARDCLEAQGVRTRGMSKNEIAERALAAGTRSGGFMSTTDFPLILANVANKTLRAAYEQAPQTFKPLVRVTSVPDFKAVYRTQLGEAPRFEKVNEHGEFKRGNMGEARESYSIATYGKVIAVTRQVIINDDLNAFTRIPSAFGMQAANLESDLVWAQIVGNPTMGDGTALFHADHGNLGTAAGLSVDSLGLAREAMRLQKGLDGATLLNITPTHVIVPVAAETKLAQLLFSITPQQTGNVVPDYVRSLTPIVEPRLDGGFTDPATGAAVSGSRFNWFLASMSAGIDTIELAYLEGNQGVYTETRTGFDVDGVEVKVRMDAGAKVIDWRPFYKNPASAL